MPSKMVTDRQKSARSVVTSIRVHNAALTEALATRLEPFLQEGETLPDVGLLLELMARELEAKTLEMVDADHTHQAQLGERQDMLVARDKALEEGRHRFLEAREIIVSIYGSERAQSVGLDAARARDAQGFSQQLSEVIKTLEGTALGRPRVRGAKVDRDVLVADLRQAHQALVASLDESAQEHQETATTQARKAAAMDAYDGVFQDTAELVEKIMLMTGHEALARDVRPSRRRRGQTTSLAKGEETASEVTDTPTA